MDDVFTARNQLTDWSLFYEYREKFWKKLEIYEKKFWKICFRDRRLIEESDLPGLVL